MDAYTKLADGGYSPATVQRTHLTLHIALKNAVDDGLLRRNPADRAFNIRLRLPQTDCLTPAEADSFLAMEREAIQYSAWRLSLTRGLRPGELCGLQDADVDLRAGRIFIRYALSLKAAAPGEPGPKVRYELDDPKTPSGRRSLDLDALTVEALRRYRAARKAEQEAMGAAFQDQGYFFAQADGRPWSPAELGSLFKRRAEKAGIRKLSLYALRHTAASVASDLGGPIKEISAMLGHTSIRTTARYLHTFPGSSVRSAHAIASAIDGAAERRDLVDLGDDKIVELPVSSSSWR
jgi:integrase